MTKLQMVLICIGLFLLASMGCVLFCSAQPGQPGTPVLQSFNLANTTDSGYEFIDENRKLTTSNPYFIDDITTQPGDVIHAIHFYGDSMEIIGKLELVAEGEGKLILQFTGMEMEKSAKLFFDYIRGHIEKYCKCEVE